jgi:hypothetical protein
MSAAFRGPHARLEAMGSVMRLAATLLIAMSTAACASWDKSETIVSEIGRVPVDQAIGLSRRDVETRLGLSPAGKLRVSGVWLEGDALVQRVSMIALSLEHRCPSGRLPSIGFTRGDNTWSNTSLIYRDDRLSALGNEPRVGDDPTQPAFLTATCTTQHRSGKQTGEDIIALAVYGPVLLPVGALLHTINAVGGMDDPDINAGLAQVPLGAAPPGGLDAWLANLPAGARLASREGDTVRVAFCGTLCEDRYLGRAVSVTLVDGKVARLEGGNCTLTPARAFHCSKS